MGVSQKRIMILKITLEPQRDYVMLFLICFFFFKKLKRVSYQLNSKNKGHVLFCF